MTQTTKGLDALRTTLDALGGKVASAVGAASMRAGLKVVAAGIATAARIHKKTGLLEESIGSRFKRKSGGVLVAAKAGVSVGKKRGSNGRRARHSHLIALGTEPRFRKRIGGRFAYIKNPTQRQLRTESTPADDFVKRGFAASESGMVSAMADTATKTLAREVAKLSK